MDLLGKEVYSPSEESGVIIKVWEDFVYVQFADRVEKVHLSSWTRRESSKKWRAKDIQVEFCISKILLGENVRFGKSADDLTTFLKAHGWCGEAPEWVKNSAAKDVSQGHFLTANYNYGTVAQDIYISCCKEFGWDEGQKEKFGEQNILYAKEATQEGFSPWFLAKHNWNEPVEKIEDMQGRCFIKGSVAEFWLEPPEEFYSDWTDRIVFANSENGYVFLGECAPSGITERIIGGKRIYEKSYEISNKSSSWYENDLFLYDLGAHWMWRTVSNEVENETYNGLSSTSELCKRFDVISSMVGLQEIRYGKDFQNIRDDVAVSLLLDISEQTFGMPLPATLSNLCGISGGMIGIFKDQGITPCRCIAYFFRCDKNSIYQSESICLVHTEESQIRFFVTENHFGIEYPNMFEYYEKNGLRRSVGWERG